MDLSSILYALRVLNMVNTTFQRKIPLTILINFHISSCSFTWLYNLHNLTTWQPKISCIKINVLHSWKLRIIEINIWVFPHLIMRIKTIKFSLTILTYCQHYFSQVCIFKGNSCQNILYQSLARPSYRTNSLYIHKFHFCNSSS